MTKLDSRLARSSFAPPAAAAAQTASPAAQRSFCRGESNSEEMS